MYLLANMGNASSSEFLWLCCFEGDTKEEEQSLSSISEQMHLIKIKSQFFNSLVYTNFLFDYSHLKARWFSRGI